MTRTSEVFVTCIGVVACSAASAAGPSATDLVSARKLFNEGLDLREIGDLDGALAKFAAADALAPTPKTRLEKGRTLMMRKQLVAAVQAFTSVKSMIVEPSSEPKYAAARSEAAKLAAELTPRLALLEIVVVGAPAGVSGKVTVDGEVIAEAALGQGRILDPGPHVLVATYGELPPVTKNVELGEGEHAKVELVLPAPPVAPPAPALPPPPPTAEPVAKPMAAAAGKPHWLFYLGLGLGSAGLVVGSVTGIVTLKKASVLRSECPEGCPVEREGELRTARTWATVSTVTFAVGLVGAGAAAIGWWLPRTSGLTPQVGLGYVGLSGRF